MTIRSEDDREFEGQQLSFEGRSGSAHFVDGYDHRELGRAQMCLTRTQWRCTRCGKLLGKRVGDRMHIRSANSSDYVASFPIEAKCCRCMAKNSASSPIR